MEIVKRFVVIKRFFASEGFEMRETVRETPKRYYLKGSAWPSFINKRDVVTVFSSEEAATAAINAAAAAFVDRLDKNREAQRELRQQQADLAGELRILIAERLKMMQEMGDKTDG